MTKTLFESAAQVTKRCGVCAAEKSLAEFFRDRRQRDDRARICRDCSRERDRLRYHTNPAYRAQVAANTAKWKARNREKLRAEYAVQVAVRRGDLIPRPCEVCGAKAHGHHADYGRPLDVRWLCPLHHARQHVAEGRLARVGSA